MPYVERGSLAQLLKAREPLPAEQTVQIGLDVARALVEAHARGIIHRDLKPANVLLGDDGIARVTDFGLARTVFNDVFVDPGQRPGEGTAPYMSPAVARGEAEDTRCDIYGLGALLYEMLTGRPPYEGASTQEILDRLVAGPPVPIREINPSASRQLTRVAEGAMGRDLRQRYSTMKDVVDDLERVGRNEDLHGPYAGWIGGSRAWNPRLRKVSLWIGSGAGFLLLLWLFADLVPNRTGEEVTNSGRAPAKEVWDSPMGLRCHTNSLGMVFVAVPGIAARFCIWETRVKDFRVFVDATAYDARGNFWSLSADGWEQRGRNWMSPGFSQTDEHPVSGVSWLDAQAFCEWLTETERREGSIGATERYRLPTDAEWSAAVGPSKFTWGEEWPPPPGTGNFAGEEAVDADWPKSPLSYSVMKDWSDGYARTSPVGWYRANRHGIYDLEGNVLEWCEDWYRKEMNSAEVLNTWPSMREDGGGQTHRTLRGASCLDALILGFTSGFRVRLHPTARYVTRGFRFVWDDEETLPSLETGSPAQP
jgi:formylglycine-generating enzyme required for sulfatase activity